MIPLDPLTDLAAARECAEALRVDPQDPGTVRLALALGAPNEREACPLPDRDVDGVKDGNIPAPPLRLVR